jgi:hypothetical protein
VTRLDLYPHPAAAVRGVSVLFVTTGRRGARLRVSSVMGEMGGLAGRRGDAGGDELGGVISANARRRIGPSVSKKFSAFRLTSA